MNECATCGEHADHIEGDDICLRIAAVKTEKDAISAQCAACADKDHKIRELTAYARRGCEALILAWGGVCPLTWTMDPTQPMMMAETIRSRGDQLQEDKKVTETALAALRAELAESNRLAHEFQRAAIENETAWQRAQDELRLLREENATLRAAECHCLDGLPQSFRDEVAFMQQMAKCGAAK